MPQDKLKFKPTEKIRAGAAKNRRSLDLGEIGDWLPNSSVIIAIIFGMVNFGTASGFIMEKVAGEVYSGYLILALFGLILMSVPMTAIFSISAILRYLKSYRKSKSLQDAVWLLISAVCLLSVVVVLAKGLSIAGGIY